MFTFESEVRWGSQSRGSRFNQHTQNTKDQVQNRLNEARTTKAKGSSRMRREPLREFECPARRFALSLTLFCRWSRTRCGLLWFMIASTCQRGWRTGGSCSEIWLATARDKQQHNEQHVTTQETTTATNKEQKENNKQQNNSKTGKTHLSQSAH